MKTLLKLSKMILPLFPVMLLAIILGSAGYFCAIGIPVCGTIALFNKFPIKMLIVMGLLRGLFHYAEQYCNHYIAFTILERIRKIVFEKLRQLGNAKMETKEKGNLVTIITSDIELLEVFYAHTVSPAFIAIIVSAGICVFLLRYSVFFSVIAFIFYAFVGIAVPMILSKKAASIGSNYRNQFADMNTFLYDNLRGLEQTILYGNGLKRLNQMKEKSEILSQFQKEKSRTEGFSTAITGLLVSMAGLTMLFVSLCLYRNKIIDFSAVIISVTTILSSFGPVIAIANLGHGLSSTIASGERILELLNEKPVTKQVLYGKTVEFNGGKTEKVDFSYGENKILSEISIDFPKNKILGIKGKSGCGKSTLIKLLMHFWEADRGKISISGVDIKNINSNCLKDMESYVTQETMLFHDTIKNNIKIAKLDADDEEIIEACKKAQIHDFIMNLPEGYETKASELGDNFSGGERQRLGLARAFLHQGDFIILDEPTSNLDSYNEKNIMDNVKKQSNGKTVIIVSHRDSTFEHADFIYDFETNEKKLTTRII